MSSLPICLALGSPTAPPSRKIEIFDGALQLYEIGISTSKGSLLPDEKIVFGLRHRWKKESIHHYSQPFSLIERVQSLP
ncbi:MAG: hypothetical protein ACRBM6_31930 [Geminicoccales bacterium]